MGKGAEEKEGRTKHAASEASTQPRSLPLTKPNSAKTNTVAAPAAFSWLAK
jgi:hypothetical protein